MLKNVITNLRKQKGLTQKQVAQFLDMSRTGYASWEQGLAEPNTNDLKKICVLYDITADELLEIENNKERKEIKDKLNV